MAEIIICADIHFGVPTRLQHSLWACRVINEYCKINNINTINVLGDLFHDRASLSIDVLVGVTNFLEKAKKDDQQWITFPGNHDMFLRYSWDINSLMPMRKYMTVINDVKLMTIDDARFWILPFVTYEKSYMQILKHIEDHAEENDVLFTHIGIRGATLNTCFMHKDWSIVSFDTSKFNRIYTGHFHNAQQIGNAWYPGSLIPFKVDEGDIPHGFYVYNTKTQDHKFIDIWEIGRKIFPNETPPPQYHTILDENINDLTEKDVKNNIIRMVLQRDYTQEEKRMIKNRLSDLGALTIRWYHTKDVASEDLLRHNSREKAGVLPHRNLFKLWTENDTKGVKDLDLALLSRTHDDVVHEGDQLYAMDGGEE